MFSYVRRFFKNKEAAFDLKTYLGKKRGQKMDKEWKKKQRGQWTRSGEAKLPLKR
jgi:hypothetical protein